MAALIIWIFLLGAAVPLLIGWFFTIEEDRRLPKALLCSLSISYGWLILSCLMPLASGANYSVLRLMICNINIAGTLGLGIALAFIQRPRVIYAVTGAWIAIGWVYFRAISFVM